MTKIKFLLFVFCFSAFQFAINAQTANDLLQQLQNKFDTVKDFTADYSGSIVSKKGNAYRFNGKVAYKKLKKIKIITKRRVIISDGTSLWTYDKKLKRVVISNSDDNPNPISIETYLYDYSKLCNVEKLENSKTGMQGLRLIPHSKKIKFKYANIWFAANFFVSKIEMVNRSSIYSVKLNHIRLNTNLKNSNFKFKIRKGVKVIDLR